MSGRNKDLVRRFIHEEDHGNWDVLRREIVSPKYMTHFPGAPPVDLDGQERNNRAFLKAFPDLEHIILHTIAEGNKVIDITTVRATHTGEFQGKTPTGKTIELWAIHFWEIENDRIVNQTVYADTAALVRQLGINPIPQQR